jgi:hypothetical protein
MKKIRTSLVLIALLFVSGAVVASGNLKVNITPAETDKAVVDVTSAAQSLYVIELKDQRGDIVFYKETKSPSDSYKKLYNFSNLDDGSYTFTVKIDNEMETKTLDIRYGDVKVLNSRKDLAPFFNFEDNKLKFSYLNFEQEDVKLYLYDSKTRDLVMEKKFDSDFAITDGLDFSKAQSGTYEAVLSGNYKFYTYEVVVD